MHVIACAAVSVLTDMVFYISMYVKREERKVAEKKKDEVNGARKFQVSIGGRASHATCHSVVI